MKKIIIGSLALALIYACGDSSKTTTTETTTTETTTTESTPAEAPQTMEFTVNATGNTMADMDYDTKEIKVKAGSTVKINLTNQGTDAAMVHNIVIVKPGTEKEVATEGISLKDKNYFNPENANVIAGSAVAAPGATVTVEFTAPSEAGTYPYICTYPGHWMKMTGVLIVE
ncbi:MAG: cupredoxin domain-containing protein [Bacteroidia bacterium]|nr:cupredoxin domain-containing protein [Bacteroidia bacterium]